ncbi:hypothetical protein ACEWY4_013480 [Coilia grayii]|uniref:Uncharacterized protein n=1 Tax=Coilia grayii TaxID=363190 RepID=A0ABD1JWH3_9TELE
MSAWQLLGVIGILVICLLLMAVVYVVYSGLFFKINIQTGSPPMRNITIAYKYKRGPYKDCGALFTECSKLGPKLNTIGVFYDDPKQVPGPLCRCVVGSILSEAGEAPSVEMQLRYETAGFRLFSFPEVTHAVCSSFPHRTPLSIFLGVQLVYPQLNAYIKPMTQVVTHGGVSPPERRGTTDHKQQAQVGGTSAKVKDRASPPVERLLDSPHWRDQQSSICASRAKSVPVGRGGTAGGPPGAPLAGARHTRQEGAERSRKGYTVGPRKVSGRRLPSSRHWLDLDYREHTTELFGVLWVAPQQR